MPDQPPKVPAFAGSSDPCIGDLRNIIPDLVDRLMHRGNFYVGDGMHLEWVHRSRESLPWATFRGHLLDPRQAPDMEDFESWNVYQIEGATRSGEPILSLKWQALARQLHITRGVLSYAWEGYDAGNNTILSREVRKWRNEIVGTVKIDSFRNVEDMEDELACLLFHAIVGISRLPITSVESPLPAFTLGQLGYWYRPSTTGADDQPLRTVLELVRRWLPEGATWIEKVKLLELVIRSSTVAILPQVVQHLRSVWNSRRENASLPLLLRHVFNEVSLTPYTDFTTNALAFVRLVTESNLLQIGERVDFLAFLLRHLCRHLSAYNLFFFHHRGANYPDLLLLDDVLKEYLECVERIPALFHGPPTTADARDQESRRSALLLACLLRQQYEGFPVPDLPTSPGENTRILKEGFPRVPQEQIIDPSKRRRRLFNSDKLERYLGVNTRTLLRVAITDLENNVRLRELGIALFLDRPLGQGKEIGERDQTPMLSYLAFSRQLARSRLRALAEDFGLITTADAVRLHHAMQQLELPGIRAADVQTTSRPGTISLGDAQASQRDFVFWRMTHRARRDLLRAFHFEELQAEADVQSALADERFTLIRAGRDPLGPLVWFDDQWRPRFELFVDNTLGTASRAGVELPVAGLRLGTVWNASGKQVSVRAKAVRPAFRSWREPVGPFNCQRNEEN